MTEGRSFDMTNKHINNQEVEEYSRSCSLWNTRPRDLYLENTPTDRVESFI